MLDGQRRRMDIPAHTTIFRLASRGKDWKRKLLRISYLECVTNDWVRSKVDFLVSPQEFRLATVERRKLAWFGHVTRFDSLSQTIDQGTLEGGQRRGQQRKMLGGQH